MESTPLTGRKSDYDDSKKKRNYIIIGVIIFLLIAIAITVTLVVVLKKKTEADNLKARLNAISSGLETQSDGLINFWETHGPDHTPGPFGNITGFHATLNQTGGAIDPREKCLVQASQNLFGYSSLVLHKDKKYLKTAKNLFEFLTGAFYQSGLDYGKFYYLVSRDGSQVVDEHFHLIAQAYTLTGLAQFFAASKEDYVDEYFEELFDDIDELFYDRVHGGFNETFDAEGKPFPGGIVQKTAICHLALVEGLYHVIRINDDDTWDETTRLVNVINLFQKHFVTDNTIHPTFNVDWTPSGNNTRLFGLELASVYHLKEAARVLNLANVTTQVDELVKKFGPVASEKGYDDKHGGYFYSQTNDHVNKKKEYLTQAYSLLGNWELYEMTKDRVYLDRIEHTSKYIHEQLTDSAHGEWFISVAEDGSHPDGVLKGTHIKSSMFSIRSTVNLPASIKSYVTREL